MRPAPDDPELVGRPAAVDDLPLFVPSPVDPRREAERRIQPERARLQAAVLEAVQRFGPLTADEIAATVGETVLAIRPRVTELGNAGLLVDTGDRRTNVSGRPATVWGRR
jgi:hypothetical protein